MTSDDLATIRRIRDDIVTVLGKTGAVTVKSSDVRSTGASIHFKFDNTVDVLTTSIEFAQLIINAPTKLVNALNMLLAQETNE